MKKLSKQLKTLRQIREERNLTHEDLMKLTGINSPMITRIESGQSLLDKRTMQRLDEVFRKQDTEIDFIGMSHIPDDSNPDIDKFDVQREGIKWLRRLNCLPPDEKEYIIAATIRVLLLLEVKLVEKDMISKGHNKLIEQMILEQLNILNT